MGEDASVRTFSITAVESIVFSGPSEMAAESASSPAMVDPYTVPSGMFLVVRMLDPIDSDVNQSGDTFRATLEEPIKVDGRSLASEGTSVEVQLVHVKQSGQLRGEEEIALQLQSITVNGMTYPLATDFAEVASEGKGGESAKVVGGGAAIGAGAGVAIQVTRGKTIRVPSEALLSFKLEKSVRLTP